MEKIIVCILLAFLVGCQGTEDKKTTTISANENKEIIQPTVAELKESEVGHSIKAAEEQPGKVRTPEDEGGFHGDYLKKKGFDSKKMDDSDLKRAMGL